MPDIFKNRIVKLLRRPEYKPTGVGDLARLLGVDPRDHEQFRKEIDQLREAGQVIMPRENLIRLASMASSMTGTFRATMRGFGFVIPTDPVEGDLFIGEKETAGAMTGDTVVAKVTRKTERKGQVRYSGEIVEIIERCHSKFVGKLVKDQSGWFVRPDGKFFFEQVAVSDIGAAGAKKDDKVVVEIISYPTQTSKAFGVIVEVLGKAGQYQSETESVIRQFHLPGVFSEQQLEEAHKTALSFDPLRSDGREDITSKTIITIDPETSQDFDDAISLEKDKKGNWVLGVHIADVSSFVQAGSVLDKEAALRGNSVYLPAKTIPMLPTVLSNGICSLQPGQKRFVKSIYLSYDKEGNVIGRTLRRSVIFSTKRLAYRQADSILSGHTKDFEPRVVELLRNCEALSRTIESRRIKNGMLELDLSETELVFDKASCLTDVIVADSSYPHKMIEMFMVEANEAVATILDTMNLNFISRVHPEPDGLSIKSLAIILRSLGFNIGKKPNRYALQNLLASVKDTENSLGVNLVILRSLSKAFYGPEHSGHYALASKYYCHFTSPIRRYADMLVHRALDIYLDGRIDAERGAELFSVESLKRIGNEISFTERRAEDAERELKTVLILGLLSKRIGQQLEGVVTGVANSGIFVQSKKFGVEGFIPQERLGSDQWYYNAKLGRTEGVRSGVIICLGTPILVKIVSTDIARRSLNLEPANSLVMNSGVKKAQKPAKTDKGKFRGGKKRGRR